MSPLVLFGILDPFSWAGMIAIGKALLLAAGAAAIVVAILNWGQLVEWFRSKAILVRSNPNNIAVMYRQAQKNGKVGVVTGVFNNETEEVLAAQSYQANTLDPQTQRQFGSNDLCVVT